mmetsp:Transcript_56325/g.100334  ORF Transcript_56325/g.100334 Transcript_56325/m.100334 type:complete len:175 (-) Transcript_56325:3589-4113(-)
MRLRALTSTNLRLVSMTKFHTHSQISSMKFLTCTTEKTVSDSHRRRWVVNCIRSRMFLDRHHLKSHTLTPTPLKASPSIHLWPPHTTHMVHHCSKLKSHHTSPGMLLSLLRFSSTKSTHGTHTKWGRCTAIKLRSTRKEGSHTRLGTLYGNHTSAPTPPSTTVLTTASPRYRRT